MTQNHKDQLPISDLTMTETMTDTTTQPLKPGRYRHYKGKDYEVIEVATHSETEEKLVVYRTLYGNFDLWVRPLHQFQEMVACEAGDVPRFRYLEPI